MEKINIENMRKILQLLEDSNISKEELGMLKERLLSSLVDNKDIDWKSCLMTLDESSSLNIIREILTNGYNKWEEIFELSNKWDENRKILLIREVISAGCKDYKLLKKEIENIQDMKSKTELLSYLETTKVVNYLWYLNYGIPLDNTKLKEIKGLTDNDLYIPGPESLGIEGNSLKEDIEKANNNLDLDKYLNNDTKSPYKK